MLSTSQAPAAGLYLFLFLFRLVLIRETMRHDSSASRRKGRTPVRRPPMPPPGGSGATPSAPRRSGPSSEFRSCWAAVRIWVSKNHTSNYNSIQEIIRTFNVNANILGEETSWLPVIISKCSFPDTSAVGLHQTAMTTRQNSTHKWLCKHSIVIPECPWMQHHRETSCFHKSHFFLLLLLFASTGSKSHQVKLSNFQSTAATTLSKRHNQRTSNMSVRYWVLLLS